MDKVEPVDPVLLAEFAAECGLIHPFRVEISLKGDMATQVHEFHQPFLLIGRRAGSDLLLDHWLVSRRHAYLQLIDGRFYCVDLGSRTGTHGGDATERAGWVDPVRAIQIGPYSVRPELPTTKEHQEFVLPVVTWTNASHDSESIQWTMNRGLALVGKSPACKIRIVRPDISRFHCGLVLTTTGVWAIDLLSQRPILVNGQTVRFARILPGDELKIGDQVLVPQYELTTPWGNPSRSALLTSTEIRNSIDASTLTDSAPDQLPALIPTIESPNQLWASSGSFSIPQGVGSAAIDPTVNHLVQQFGAMQQQMFDQFHQTMMMMFEGFAALHRETSTSITQEFEEVRKLSQEIETLREETSKLAEATTMSFQAPAFLKADQRQSLSTNHHTSSNPAHSPLPNPASQPQSKVIPPLPDPHVDIHAQLCDRLNSIAAERQTRWQKILGMMAKT